MEADNTMKALVQQLLKAKQEGKAVLAMIADGDTVSYTCFGRTDYLIAALTYVALKQKKGELVEIMKRVINIIESGEFSINDLNLN